jgi:hypothetical protein
MQFDKFPEYSGMNFVSDNAYPIEDSQASKNLNKNGIHSVEFIRSNEDKLLFIEAKSSFPNPNNIKKNPDKGNKTGSELFRERIDEICDKFTHSLSLYSAIDMGVINEDTPSDFKVSDSVSLVFILVINGFEQSWCTPIEKAIINQLNNSVCMANIWKPTVRVINHETAQRRKIIV